VGRRRRAAAEDLDRLAPALAVAAHHDLGRAAADIDDRERPFGYCCAAVEGDAPSSRR
jgi:hypothetical protein